MRQLLAERHMSQAELARRIGVVQQTVSYICNSKSTIQRSAYLTNIADALGVNANWLQTGVGSKTDIALPEEVARGVARVTQVPVIRFEHVRDFCEGRSPQPQRVVISESVGEDGFAITLPDDKSMNPRFSEGNLLVIDPDVTPEPGDYVVALLHSGEAVLRRYRRRAGEGVLVAENTDWGELTQDDVEQIVGTMVECRSYRGGSGATTTVRALVF